MSNARAQGRGDPDVGVSRARRVTGALTLLASLAAAALVALPGGASASAPQWRVAATPNLSRGTILNGISCPTAETCFALSLGPHGASVLSTQNGGSSWTKRALPVPRAPYGIDLGNIVCQPNTTVCIATGDTAENTSGSVAQAFVLSTSNGTSWSEHSVPDVGRIGSLSCPTALICVGGASGLDVEDPGFLVGTKNGGATWQTATALRFFAGLSVTCGSPTTCFAAGTFLRNRSNYGGMIETQNSGETWQPISALHQSGISTVDSLSCHSATNCIALGTGFNKSGQEDGQIFVTTSGWVTWSSHSVAVNTFSYGLEGFSPTSCTSINFCETFEQGDGFNNTFGALEVTQAGAEVTAQSLPRVVGGVSGVSCSSTSKCLATENPFQPGVGNSRILEYG